MAKRKKQAEKASEVETSVVVADDAAVAEVVDAKQPEVEYTGDAPQSAKAFKGVYRVEITDCLLGVRYVRADSPVAALEKYKASCGITQHPQWTAEETYIDPENLAEGIELFGEVDSEG